MKILACFTILLLGATLAENFDPQLSSFQSSSLSQLAGNRYSIFDNQTEQLNLTIDYNNMELTFDLDLINVSRDIEPYFYNLESVKSAQEEKIHLTPPMVCKLQPSVHNFSIINHSSEGGYYNGQIKNGRDQALVLDKQVLMIDKEMFKVMNLHQNQSMKSNVTIKSVNYTFNGKFQLFRKNQIDALQHLNSYDTFIVRKGDQKFLMKLKLDSTNSYFSQLSDYSFTLVNSIEDFFTIFTPSIDNIVLFSGVQLDESIQVDKIFGFQDGNSSTLASSKYAYHISSNASILLNSNKTLVILKYDIASGQYQQNITNITDVSDIYLFQNTLVTIQESTNAYFIIEYKILHDGTLIHFRSYNAIDGLKQEDIVKFMMDSKYIYIYSDKSMLYIIKHSIPSTFTPSYVVYNLPNTLNILPITSFADPLNYFLLVHTDYTISVLAPFNSTSNKLSCIVFPKPNQFNVLVQGFTNDCYLQLMGDTNDQNSYCMIQKYYSISLGYEDTTVGMSQTKFNMAVVIALSVVFGLIFFGIIAYTIYWKTKQGWYDDNNNEITDPEQRKVRQEQLESRKYNEHEDEHEPDIIVRSSNNRAQMRSDGFERITDIHNMSQI